MSALDYPRVSIVTPSYNQGQFIEETIISVLGQNYPNLEYIIIDGGSTDHTLEIISKYQDLLYYWVSEPDSGQSHALNKGFSLATGDIVAWLNADDVYLNNTIEKAVAALSDGDEDIVYSRAKLTSPNGEFIKMYDPPDRVVLRDLLLLWRGDFVCPPQPSVFMNRQVLDTVGGVNESLDYAMDYDLWLKAIDDFKFKFVDDVWSEYRVHSDSKTGRGFEPFIDEIIRIGSIYQSQLGLRDRFLLSHFGKRAFLGKHYLDLAYDAMTLGDDKIARNYMFQSVRNNPWLIVRNRGAMKMLTRLFFL